jgi:hypothetical protein
MYLDCWNVAKEKCATAKNLRKEEESKRCKIIQSSTETAEDTTYLVHNKEKQSRYTPWRPLGGE